MDQESTAGLSHAPDGSSEAVVSVSLVKELIRQALQEDHTSDSDMYRVRISLWRDSNHEIEKSKY